MKISLHQLYYIKLRLGAPGYDTIITKKSIDLKEAIESINNSAHIQLSKIKDF